jgi:hypothetical protein
MFRLLFDAPVVLFINLQPSDKTTGFPLGKIPGGGNGFVVMEKIADYFESMLSVMPIQTPIDHSIDRNNLIFCGRP